MRDDIGEMKVASIYLSPENVSGDRTCARDVYAWRAHVFNSEREQSRPGNCCQTSKTKRIESKGREQCRRELLPRRQQRRPAAVA